MLNNIEKWLTSYVCQQIRQIIHYRPWSRPTHVIFCFVDHFEPDWHAADDRTQWARVRQWIEKYPQVTAGHHDRDGCLPKHTFFYPAEVYVPEHLESLAGLCRRGYGEVEIHLHHEADTPDTLRQKLEKGKQDFARHGMLGEDRKTGETRYAFIHGNWALNNSRPDGKWCGVNDESRILTETGCYADYTFPSAPSVTQPAMINRIYYDVGDSARPASHETGRLVAADDPEIDRLMIVEGPLTLNWRHRRRGIFPRIENGDVTGHNPPTPQRVALWVKQRISVGGRPDWIFVKVHTHGATERNAPALLGQPMASMLETLETQYNDGRQFVLHYASAREMYNMIKAAESGEEGDPGTYRDYRILWNGVH